MDRIFRPLLWAGFSLTLPLPYFMIEPGRVPAAQLYLFAAVTGPLLYTDPGFTSGFIAGLFLAQSVLAGVLLWLLAGWIARRIAPPQRARAAVAFAVGLVVLALLPIYRAPLTHGPTPTNWLGVWR